MKIKFGDKLSLNTNYFVTSDLHFHHKNILKFCPDTRPWVTVEEMNEALIQHWNSFVKEGDVVFHLGDMFFCNKDDIEYIISRLNGHIVHLFGNHSKVLRNQFQSLNTFDYLEVSYKGSHIVMNHYAQRVWNRAHYGSLHIYGHSHGSLSGVGRSMDVGWDAVGKILTLDEVVDTLSKRDIYCEDMH